MRISETMETAMNTQMKDEFDSAFLYLSMSSWFQDNNLPGFAHWCYVQFQEEQEHAMKFYNYIVSRQGKAKIDAVSKPKQDWNTPEDVFQAILNQEIKVTSLINDLYKKAKEEDDYASQSFLNWFLDEQIEEEEQSADILNKIKMAENSNAALLFLDKEMSKRKEEE